MTLDAWYWLLMALWFFFGGWRIFVVPPAERPYLAGNHALIFVLFVLIGLKNFGSPFK